MAKERDEAPLGRLLLLQALPPGCEEALLPVFATWPPSAGEQGPRGWGHTAGQTALQTELLRGGGSVGGR